MKTLNIGAGWLNRSKEEVALDTNFACRPTVQGDAQNLPFKDNTFDSVVAIHVLEHIQNIVQTMNEVWRVLKQNGEFNIRVPLFPTLGSIADPTHVRFFIPDTFDYFTERGKLTGLGNVFKMEAMKINNLSNTTQEIQCRMIK